MNLPSLKMLIPRLRDAARARADKIIFGQNALGHLQSAKPFMFLSFARRAAICLCWGMFLAVPAIVRGQTNIYAANGTEYPVVGSLPGDEVFPDVSVTPAGGFAVWQNNATDGDGWGISARRLDSTLSGTLSTFRVNVQGTNDQENARVKMLKNGGAAVVWQGGREGYQHIFGRFLSPSNTFLTSTDLVVSTFANTNSFQIQPALATLNNGNVVIVWSSYNQAGSTTMQDVYCKILSPTGQTISNEFLVNQFTSFNQRTPSVAALNNGGFVVAWVSEQQRKVVNSMDNINGTPSAQVTLPSTDIYARLYSATGAAAGAEFLVNTDASPCANPSVAAGSDGGFMVAWTARDLINTVNGLDVFGRLFSSGGAGGTVLRLNSQVNGDQYAPHLSSNGTDYMAVWTSLGQDGSREGVFRQFINGSGLLVGTELRVNTTTISQQMHPVVVSDGANQFLVVWTSFTGLPNHFDLFAQRYLNVASVLQPMSAPFVYAPFTLSNGVYQPQLQVAWPVLLGISVSNYEVYADGTKLAVMTGNQWLMTAANGLTAGSTHSFQVDYVTTDNHRSPLSPATVGTTWGGNNWGGVPYEWMMVYFGGNTNLWPSPGADSDHDGMNNAQEFLTGTDPKNAASVLRVQAVQSGQGMFLSWPTVPGHTYQVQVKTGLTAAWGNFGTPRFAAGTSDSVYVGGGGAGYYQVMLLQ